MHAHHAGEVFDRGAAVFERIAPALWNPMGNAVVAAADISLEERVLDACCGSGASTIPAAQSTGPGGLVDAVDLSAGLLALARDKAAAMSLDHVRFTRADIMQWQTDTPYDAVLCCYGLFFLPDMAGATVRLSGLLRPGGRLALSTWDDGAHEPFNRLLWESCVAERPELGTAPRPQAMTNVELLSSEPKLSRWLLDHGFDSVTVDRAPLDIPLDDDLAWSLVLGSGFRDLLPADAAAVARVRESFLTRIGDGFVFNADSLIAVARTPE